MEYMVMKYKSLKGLTLNTCFTYVKDDYGTLKQK